MTTTKEMLDQFIHKRIEFRYFRQSLIFDLSQSLFSSFEVDVGTRLLLKSLAKELDLTTLNSVLDVGCGVGVIGLSLKKVNPALTLTAQDRDALAHAFTERNAGLNGIDDVLLPDGLALQGLGDARFDLIVSNLPGKAGPPVLVDILTRMSGHLTESGRAAVVIVKPLAPLVAQTLDEMDASILYQETGKGYELFHFRGGQAVDSAVSLTPYLRTSQRFEALDTAYRLQTVYNLPEFDTLGFHSALAMEMLKMQPVNGRVLVWNPGQGHLPVFLHKRMGTAVSHITIASRDLLSLTITKKNLLTQKLPAANLALVHVPSILDIIGQYDWVVYLPDYDPGFPWHTQLPITIEQLLIPGGYFLPVGKSSFVQRLIPELLAFRKIKDKRRRGFRALCLQYKLKDSGR